MARKTRQDTNGVANSLRELARGVDRSHQSVADWVKHARWNQSRTPPWSIRKAVEWAAATLPPNPATAWTQPFAAEPGSEIEALRRSPLSAAKLKLTLTRAAKLELERAALAGELINRQEVEQALVRRAHAVRAAFQALPRQVAVRLAGKNEIEVECLLLDAIDGVLLELSQQTRIPDIPESEAS